MAAESSDKALAERLKAKEDELRKREKDVRQRETAVRERQEALSAGKAANDALTAELHARETAIAELERKHGGLKRRNDELTNRETLLVERESALQQRLLRLAVEEQDSARRRADAAVLVEEEQQQITALRAKVETRTSELDAAEAALSAQRAMHLKHAQEDDEILRRREKVVSDGERRLAAATRTMELRQLETEQLQEQVSERLRQVRQDQMELEARLREVRWKDESLKEMLQAATAQKTRLTEWEDQLTAREAKLVVKEAELAESAAKIKVRESDVARRGAHASLAEQDIIERESRLGTLQEQLEQRSQDIDQREHALAQQRTLADAHHQTLDSRDAELKKQQSVVDAREKQVGHAEHSVRERERALKSWLLELEYRQRAVEHREAHPRPYLDASNVEPEAVLKSPGDLTTAHFNRALVGLQVAHLQRAYLGAQTSKRIDIVRPSSRGAAANSTTTHPGTFEQRAVDAAKDACLVAELETLEPRFRDLTAGFATMTDDERAALFTSDETAELVRLIEEEAQDFDEYLFLKSMSAVTMPPVSVTLAPQDSTFAATVQRWAMQREELLEERLRRSRQSLLRTLSRAVEVLQGRVPTHADRVASLTAVRVPARATRPTVGGVDGVSSSPTSKRRAKSESVSWKATARRNEPSPTMSRTSSLPRLGYRPSTPSSEAHRRLVSALPEDLRHHYSTAS